MTNEITKEKNDLIVPFPHKSDNIIKHNMRPTQLWNTACLTNSRIFHIPQIS